jgi:pimeloyl-ACP methyl ester carboxylesterase
LSFGISHKEGSMPVLAVLWEKSQPIFAERRELLLARLPNVEPFVLPAATHLLHVENPRGMAEALTAFYAQHPLAASGQVHGGLTASFPFDPPLAIT